jgi:cytochrome P450
MLFSSLQWSRFVPPRAGACLPPRVGGRFVSSALALARHGPLQLYLDAWRGHGDLVRFEVPGHRWYLAAHPDAVRHVLVNNASNYCKPAVLLEPLRLAFGEGLFTTEGEPWRQFRRWAQPPFLGRTGQMAWKSSITQALEETFSEWDSRPANRLADVREEMAALVLRTVSRSLFGRDARLDCRAFVAAMTGVLDYLCYRMSWPVKLPLWAPTPRNLRFLRARQILTGSVSGLLRDYRASAEAGEGMLAHLLGSRPEGLEGKAGEQYLRELLLTLLFATVESVGTGLFWAWLLVARHPAVERKLLDEAAVGSEVGSYPRMVFQEALRLYPTGWVQPRQAIADDALQGFDVPRGTVIILSQYLTHRHPAFWEAPEEFVPERFAPEALGAASQRAYFPFGLGSHLCPGVDFALCAGPLLLSALVNRYRLEPASATVPRLKAWSFFLEPAEGLAGTLHRRTGPDGRASLETEAACSGREGR